MASGGHRLRPAVGGPVRRARRRVAPWVLLGATALLTVTAGCTSDASSPAGTTPAATPQDLPRPAAWPLAAGLFHTCAVVDAEGQVKCWGNNEFGQLGQGDTRSRGAKPDQMGSALPLIDLGSEAPVVALAAGYTHTCALFKDASVACWGGNEHGELGLGDRRARGDGPGEMGRNLPRVDLGRDRVPVALAAGLNHTCALFSAGTVACWGSGADGNLGRGSRRSIGSSPGQMGDALKDIDLGHGRRAAAITASGRHTCALLDDRQVKCWGFNAKGQLGLGDRENRGDDPGEMGDRLPVVDLGRRRSVVAVESNGYHTCALLDGRQLKCWGYNDEGQLGLGDRKNRGDAPGEMGDRLPVVDLGPGLTVSHLSSGYETCVVLVDRRTVCWGYNDYGEVGRGDTTHVGGAPGDMGRNLIPVDLGTRHPEILVGGGYHNCARLDDRSIRCWGLGYYGQLGSGTPSSVGDAPGELGASPPVSLE